MGALLTLTAVVMTARSDADAAGPVAESALAGPFSHKRRSLGSIYLTERSDKLPFTEADEAFLRVACTVAAVFINEKYATMSCTSCLLYTSPSPRD